MISDATARAVLGARERVEAAARDLYGATSLGQARERVTVFIVARAAYTRAVEAAEAEIGRKELDKAVAALPAIERVS